MLNVLERMLSYEIQLTPKYKNIGTYLIVSLVFSICFAVIVYHGENKLLLSVFLGFLLFWEKFLLIKIFHFQKEKDDA